MLILDRLLVVLFSDRGTRSRQPRSDFEVEVEFARHPSMHTLTLIDKYNRATIYVRNDLATPGQRRPTFYVRLAGRVAGAEQRLARARRQKLRHGRR